MTLNVIKKLILNLLYLIPSIFSISDSSINFSIDYFEAVNVKHLCLLTCGGNWHLKFVKHVSPKNIGVSSINVSKTINESNTDLDACLRNHLIPIGILIDQKCPELENIMIYASKRKLFDSNHKWLIIDEKFIHDDNYAVLINEDGPRKNKTHDKIYNTDTSFVIFLYNLNLSINADITVAITEDLRMYRCFEVFNFGKHRNGTFTINNIGDWNFKTGLNITRTYKYYRRWDYQQMPFKVIIVITPVPDVYDPKIVLGSVPGPGVAVIQQTGTQVLHEVATAHNIRFVHVLVDRWIGDYNRNHSYAASSAIYFGDVDITPILRFTSTHFDRFDVVFPPVAHMETRYFYRIPEHGVGNFENQFLTPLSPTTWWCVVVIGVLCGIVLLLSAVVEDRKISVDFAVFSVLALICQQFFEEFEDIRRISTARKMTTLVTGLSCLVIYNYYTSSVVSWLLNGPPPTIHSLWELLDSPLQPIFEDVGYVHSWLELPDYYFNKKSSKAEDVLKRRVSIMQRKGIPILKPVFEGIEMMQQGGYVYYAELFSAYTKISEKFTQSELCDLGTLPGMEKTYLYSGVPKNSPYKEFFTWSLSRFLERGVINCIQQRTWPKIVKCEGSSPRALALGGAAPAFILLAGGFVLGVIIMFLEKLKWRYDIAKNKKQLI